MIMIASKFKKFLGSGLYTVGEAALYARVTPAMMARWLFGNQRGEAVLHPQFDPHERMVSFLDLIQTLAIREIRMQRQIALPKFRQAVKVAKEKLGLDYPFARKHCTYLYNETLVIRSRADHDEFVEASGQHRGARLFPFVEMYLDDLTFDPRTGLVNAYQIFTSDRNVPITMNPHRRFGEPLLPSGYTPFAIWQAINAEGGIERTAKLYDIPFEEVEASYQFVVRHLGKTAA